MAGRAVRPQRSSRRQPFSRSILVTAARFDVVIVGSGAGGSACAYGLARAGKRVLVLERGPRLPTDGTTLDVDLVARRGAWRSRERWLDAAGREIELQEYANLGGKTKWYGAALLRYADDEFEANAERHFLPWPFGPGELAPYYDEAERLLGVRTFDAEPDLRRIVAGLESGSRGWQSAPLPLGLAPDILADPQEARHFDGYASPRGLKGDAERFLRHPELGGDRLSVRTDAEVIALEPSGTGGTRVAGVRLDSGEICRADTVLLAAGAVNSPRLLQRYVDDAGLSDRLPSARLIGCYYKAHVKTFLLAFGARTQTDLLRKTVLLRHARFPHSSVQTLGWLDGEILATQLPGLLPRFVANALGRRAYGFFLQTEEGSLAENRVRRRANASERPCLDVQIERDAGALREHRALVRAFRRDLLASGYLSGIRAVPVAATAHACGTLVTGTDPGQSVVDPCGRVHGLDNLYVVDGSVLPRASRVNPALTIYAWGLRVARLLTDGVHS